MYSIRNRTISIPMVILFVSLLLIPAACLAIPDGDLDNDQVVTIADALISLRIAVNLLPVNQQALDHGDVFPQPNGAPAPDGVINISDALTILRKVVGLIQWDLVPGLPSVIAVTPTAGSVGIAASTTISVTFSEPVDGRSVTTSTFAVRDDTGNPVSGSTATIGATAFFTPDENLAFLSGYTAAVTTGVSDQGGNPLAAEQSWSFTTRDWPQIALAATAAGFVQPVAISHPGDGSGRIFVVEQGGTVRLVRNGAILGTPFLDIRGIVTPAGGEQGLLGIAFPPAFAAKGYFYVHYNNRQNVGDTVIARYRLTADPDLADPASGQVLLTLLQPFGNHNGGQLAFGPDGLFYIGLGDGGSGGDPLNNAQNLNTLLGKILRIDTEAGVAPYRVPTTNPLLGGRVSEIWAYGLRNPWRFSFDRKSGDLYIGDVGQGLFEEINFQPAGNSGGVNYGWNIMEGAHCFTDPACSQVGLVLPVQEYQHIDGNCSVTGGYVYRGTEFPELRGIYFYGDFCSGTIWGIRQINGQWQNRLLLDTTFQISTFGEDEAGALYLADYATGIIHRIVSP
jgi:glucose/arabinose dehydrogenase